MEKYYDKEDVEKQSAELMEKIKATYEGFSKEQKEKYKDVFESVLKGDAKFQDLLKVQDLCKGKESKSSYDEIMEMVGNTYSKLSDEDKRVYKAAFERILEGTAPFRDILLVRNLCKPKIREPKIRGAKQFKIISDGTSYGTEIYGPDGNKIAGIESATIEISGDQPLIKLTLESRCVKLGLDGEMIFELNSPKEKEKV